MEPEHEQSKTKMFMAAKFNQGKGLKLTWGNIAAIVTIVILIVGWFVDRGVERERFRRHEEDMGKMEIRLQAVEQKASLVVVQDVKLKELARRLGKLEK